MEFCAEHYILSEDERIKMQGSNDAFDERNDKEVGFRDVIDRVFRKDAQLIIAWASPLHLVTATALGNQLNYANNHLINP